MPYSRMAICEAVADDALKDIVSRMQDHVRDTPGLIDHSILVEEGGRMVILVTNWPNRQECLTYHASRACRQLVAATQHMLVGDYVVKTLSEQSRDEVTYRESMALAEEAPELSSLCQLEVPSEGRRLSRRCMMER